MTDEVAGTAERPEEGRRDLGTRFGQLLTLLGLTGLAIGQPLLAVASEDPTLFTFAGVRGGGIIAFALAVALGPPLVLWAVVVAVGLVDRRAGDLTFLVVIAVLAGTTGIQWVKAAGTDSGWVLGVVGVLTAVLFTAAFVRFHAVPMWTRFTAPLPVLAVVLLLVASPVGDLLRSPDRVAASGDGRRDLPDVVFIMLDELPLKTLLDADGQIDAVRFPNMAAFAGRATWYRDYTSMSYGTVQAVPSILSGRVPDDGQPLWTDKPDNLFSLLAPTHDLTVSETITQLCGYTSCGIESAGRRSQASGLRHLLGQMVDVWQQRVRLGPVDDLDLGQFEEAAVPLDPEVDRISTEGRITDEDQVRARPERITDFLEAIEPSTVPELYYLHMMLPHQPWSFYPNGQMYDGRFTFLGLDVVDDWTLAQHQQGHIFQTQYADRVVGEILDRLEEEGMFDDALIVVTADHGVNFETPPQLRRLERWTIDDLAYVPLFVKEPNQTEGRIDDTNLMGTDVVPTIAQELGVEVGWEVDGFPAGSAEIEARGDTKQIYDFGDRLVGRFEGVVDFESSEHRPTAADRLIGPIGPDDGPLAGLVARLGAEGEMGRSVADLGAQAGPGTMVVDLEDLRDPPTGKPLPGRVTGKLDDPSLGDLVLVAVDGTVVTAAPVQAQGWFQTVLPPDALDPSGGNEVAVVQVGPEGAHLLELQG